MIENRRFLQYMCIKLTFYLQLGLIRCKIFINFHAIMGKKFELVIIKIKTL